MAKFAKILKDLMDENSMTPIELAGKLGINDPSIIYRWLNEKLSMFLDSAIKLADIFGCSLDYLCGRIEIDTDGSYKACPPFDVQLKKVLGELHVSQYRLVKDKVVSGGHIDSWLSKKRTPHIESLIRLADYLKVSLDYLVGREA